MNSKFWVVFVEKYNIIRFSSLLIALFGGFLFLSSYCNSHLPTKDGLYDSTILTTNNDVDAADSVVWNMKYRAAHLYKYEKDTTHYLLRYEFEEARQSTYFYSKEVQDCCKMMQDKFMNSLGSLSKNQLDALLQDTLERTPAFLIECRLDKDGNKRRLEYYFLTTSEERIPDSVIRDIDKNVSSVKFPPLKNFGITFNVIKLPIRKDALREYIKKRFDE